MIENTIPIDLRNIIDSEETDFIVKSRKNYPTKNGLAMLGFAVFWNAFVSIFVFVFIAPLLMGEEVHFTVNDMPETASIENWEPAVMPSLIIGVFVVVGIGMLIWALVLLFQKGGYFVGTETRLIKYRKGKVTIKDWEQFSGNMKIKNNGVYGNLELELRTGKIRSSKNKPDRFVPDIMYLSKIKNVFGIEKKCRIRIKENDPTPSTTAT